MVVSYLRILPPRPLKVCDKICAIGYIGNFVDHLYSGRCDQWASCKSLHASPLKAPNPRTSSFFSAFQMLNLALHDRLLCKGLVYLT